jgi:tetratricopeptide (TPR) repeat protein
MNESKKADGYYDRGIAYAQVGEFDKAIAEFTEAIRRDPNYLFAYNNRANCYAAKGDHDMAVAEFTQIIRLDHKYADGYYNRANSYASRGEHDKAIADYTEAIRLDSKMADAYLCRGSVYASNGEHDKAIADCTEAIRLNPKDVRAYAMRAGAYRALGDDANAANDERKAHQMPKAITCYNRGWSYAQNGEYDEAIVNFTEAIRLDPELADAYRDRGTCHAQKGEYDQAIADLTEAIRLDPEQALAYYNRGGAKLGRGDYEGAIADYDADLQVNPNHANAYYKRGYAWIKRGEWDKAIADLNKAIELNPQDASAHANRALARGVKGDSEGSAADYARAKELSGDAGDASYFEPPAPEGYCWERAGKSQALLLRPDGWHFKAVEQGDSLAYFITREPIPADAKLGSYQFETGFTINVWRGFGQARGMAPSAYALAYVQEMVQLAELEVEGKWQYRGDTFVGYVVQHCSDTDIGRLRQQVHLIANDRTGTLHILRFETPKRLWERDWTLAKVVMENLRLHQDV